MNSKHLRFLMNPLLGVLLLIFPSCQQNEIVSKLNLQIQSEKMSSFIPEKYIDIAPKGMMDQVFIDGGGREEVFRLTFQNAKIKGNRFNEHVNFQLKRLDTRNAPGLTLTYSVQPLPLSTTPDEVNGKITVGMLSHDISKGGGKVEGGLLLNFKNMTVETGASTQYYENRTILGHSYNELYCGIGKLIPYEEEDKEVNYEICINKMDGIVAFSIEKAFYIKK